MPIYRMTVSLAFPGGTKAGTNTWHVRTTDIPVGGPPSITDAIKDFYQRNVADFGGTYSWTWDGSLAQVDSATPSYVALASGWTVTGSSGGATDSGPAGVGLVIGWKSALATKRGRGRTFLAPIPRQYFEADGTIDGTFLGHWRDSAAQLLADSIADGNGAVSVWSHLDNVGRDIVATKVNDKVAYLSSRRS